MTINDILSLGQQIGTNRISARGQKAETAFKEGDIIEGTVSMVTSSGDAKKVTFGTENNQVEYSLPPKTVTNTYVGDKRRFEVVTAGPDRFVLKDLGSVIPEAAGPMCFSRVDPNLSAMVEDFSETMGDKEKEDTSAIRNLSDEDYSLLHKEGFNIEEYKAEQLELVVEHVKEGLKALRESAEEGRDTLKNEARNIKKQAYNNLCKGSPARRLAIETLINSDLAVTAENIDSLLQAGEMAKKAAMLSDVSCAYLVKNELSPSIINIYNAVYLGKDIAHPLPEADLKALAPQLSDIVSRANLMLEERSSLIPSFDMQVTEESEGSTAYADTPARTLVTVSDAVRLLEHDIPLTADNLIYDKQLHELATECASPLFYEKAVTAGAYAMAEGKTPPEGLLIPAASTKTAASKELSEKLNRINHRLELENARLKLTGSTVKSLLQKGINIETASDDTVIRELENERKELYRKLFSAFAKDTGESDTFAAVSGRDGLFGISKTAGSDINALSELALDTERALTKIQAASTDFYKEAFPERHQLTLRSASDIALRYISSETEIRPDLGDNITKAFRSIDGLLKGMELELSDANRSAVKILARNDMEITPESVNEIKYFSQKLDRLVENLQPAMVMSLIRRGINPLYTTVDALSELTDRILEAEGYSPEEKYSSFLVKLEERNDITEEERNAFIGIYRLLYRINRNDCQALGALVKSGKEFTLGNLLTEERTANLHSFSTAVDDTAVVYDSHYENSITGQIDSAFAYQRSLLRNILSTDTPDSWHEMYANVEENAGGLHKSQPSYNPEEEIHPDFTEISLEHLSEMLDTADNMITGDASKAGAIVRAAMANLPLRGFLKAFGAADSVKNIRSLEERSLLPVSLTGLREALLPVADNTASQGSAATQENALPSQPLNGLIENTAAQSEETAYASFEHVLTASQSASLTAQLDMLGLTKELAREKHFSFCLDTAKDFGVRITFIRNSSEKNTLSVRMGNRGHEITARLNVTATKSATAFEGSEASHSRGSVSGSISLPSDDLLTDPALANDLAAKAQDFIARLNREGFNAEHIGISQKPVSESDYYEQLAGLKASEPKASTNENTSDRTLYKIALELIESFT